MFHVKRIAGAIALLALAMPAKAPNAPGVYKPPIKVTGIRA